ncbi:DUF5819 family protein [Streptomyces sp. AV19]|uniref:DUF5819 family protein n=1 Tax=Streptomyces sp. AV19 TaxID=2793068 RepID=UPI001F47D79F|nr:DUF5819 family protein [Streptomyces sp. AV19]MDG4530763.1 DUF5819 family protein [Streptomyces sp. AV19]
METDDGHEPEGGADAPAPAGLSRPARWIVALGAVAVALAATAHLVIMFLHVAPANTISKQHAATIGDYVLPEFEQNWKFFAPNPLQQNIAVQVRAQVTGPDGRTRLTSWTDLSAQDGAAILHNPLPSHTQQNELRRAWDFYGNTHDDRGQSTGMRGDLAEEYLRRLAVARLDLDRDGTRLHRVQLRSVTTAVTPPPWAAGQSGQPATKPAYRELGWWRVTDSDLDVVRSR